MTKAKTKVSKVVKVAKTVLKNTPNMFRVSYQVTEGDSYAGRYIRRTVDIADLGDAINIPNIVEVYPGFVELFDVLDPAVVEKAIADRWEKTGKQEAIDAVKLAEQQLELAKQKLS